MNTQIQPHPHQRSSWLPIAAAWVAACGAAEAQDEKSDAATPRQTVSDEKPLLAGEIAEAILFGGSGDRAVIQLSAPTAALDWNLHGHSAEESLVIKEGFGITETTYSFSPTSEQDWWLLLSNARNKPTTVAVTLELYGEMEWRGWQ